MKWNVKQATGICWDPEYSCAELDRLEGKDIACEQCMVVNGFLHDVVPRFDSAAHEHMVEFYAFLIRVANAGRID